MEFELSLKRFPVKVQQISALCSKQTRRGSTACPPYKSVDCVCDHSARSDSTQLIELNQIGHCERGRRRTGDVRYILSGEECTVAYNEF